MKAGKPVTMPLDPALRAAMREAYEERAAIMEFDGGTPRGEAEKEARALVLKEYLGG